MTSTSPQHRTGRRPAVSPVVLVGVHGSDASWRAAAYAAGLAQRQCGMLAIVYVQPLTVPAMAAVTPGSNSGLIVGAAYQAAQSAVGVLRRRVEQLGAETGLPWELHTIPGRPLTGLMHAADELQADAVVVGASRRPLQRLFGSLPTRLAATARWPVIVVP